MKQVIFDIETGVRKGEIKAFEQDNGSDIYKIILMKNKRRYDLTGKTVRMVMIDQKQNIKDMMDITIIDAKKGELNLPVSNIWTKKDGYYSCQLAVFGTESFLEHTMYFWINIKNSLFDDVADDIVSNPQFEVLKQEFEKIQNGLIKIDEWDKLFSEIMPNIEQKYETRLNVISSQLSESVKIPYLGTPFNYYIYNSNYANGKIFFSWEGNLVIPSGVSLSYETAKVQFSNKLETSPEGKVDCIALNDGEWFVYNLIEKKFEIITYYEIDNAKHKIITNSISGNSTEGYLCENVNINNEWDSNLKELKIFKKQKYNIQNATSRALNHMNINDNTHTFAFITDIHQQEWNQGFYSMGINILNRLINKNLIDFTINGGDNILWASEKNVAIANHAEMSNRVKGDFYYAIGNHDYNGWDEKKPQPDSDFIKGRDLYNIYGRSFSDKVTWGSKEKMYYYFDKGDLRIIVLNPQDVPNTLNSDGTRKYNPTQVFAFQQEQLNWLGDILLNSTYKHVLLVSHVPLLHNDEGMYANNLIPYNNTVVREMLEHFKEGTRYTYNNEYSDSTFNSSGDVNFTQPNRVVGVLSGHIHYDCDVVKNTIRHVARNCDFPVKWDNTGVLDSEGETPVLPDRIVGDYSQYCFDILTVDTYNTTVNMTRFGVGEDYYFSY